MSVRCLKRASVCELEHCVKCEIEHRRIYFLRKKGLSPLFKIELKIVVCGRVLEIIRYSKLN